MSDRAVTVSVQNAIELAEAPDALIAFLVIEHPSLADPIRVVSDLFDYVVGGLTYVGMPFGYRLLTDDESAPQTQLRIQNVDRRIGKALLSMRDRAVLTLTIRTSADFNLAADPRTEIASSVIYGFTRFDLVDVSGDAAEITGRVILRDYSQETWPGIRATQSRCPGLFR